jgi:hypothetical protein
MQPTQRLCRGVSKYRMVYIYDGCSGYKSMAQPGKEEPRSSHFRRKEVLLLYTACSKPKITRDQSTNNRGLNNNSVPN